MFARWAAAPLIAALLAVPAHADPVDEFYKGKQINLIVGFGPGGGYDIYARVLARHLAGSSPAIPTSSCRPCREPAACAPPTTSTILRRRTAPRSVPSRATCRCSASSAAIRTSSSTAQRFTWLGSSSSFANDAYILIVRSDAPVKSIDDARRTDLPALVLGGTGEGATGNDVPVILRDTIGLHVKQVVGYPTAARSFSPSSAARSTGAPSISRRSRR